MYSACIGKRIMVLGESHYCDEGCADCGDCRLHRECMGFTQGVLRDYLDEGTERQNGDDIVVDGYHVATLVCLEQWQAGKGNGREPSLRRLFMGLLVQSD